MAARVFTSAPHARRLAPVGQRSQSETLAAILKAFLDQRTWKQADLARHVGVLPATIKKHLEELRASGVPLESEKDHPHVFWSVPRSCSSSAQDGSTPTAADGGGDGGSIICNSGGNNGVDPNGACTQTNRFGVCGADSYSVSCVCPSRFCVCTKNSVMVGTATATADVCATCEGTDSLRACGFPKF